jgi:hypothetical protein
VFRAAMRANRQEGHNNGLATGPKQIRTVDPIRENRKGIMRSSLTRLHNVKSEENSVIVRSWSVSESFIITRSVSFEVAPIYESRGGLLAEGQIHRSLGHRPRWRRARPSCWLKANLNSQVNMAFGRKAV